MNELQNVIGVGGMADRGANMQTASGKAFYPLDPRPEEIDIYDIAAHLSKICRFNGATKSFYSVAQHSVLVSDLVPQHLRVQALLHDATEAYVGDMIRPIKIYMPEYQNIEAKVWLAIAQAFELPIELDPIVKLADNQALAIEKRDIMAPSHNVDWGTLPDIPEPYEHITYHAVSPDDAEQLFVARFHEVSDLPMMP